MNLLDSIDTSGWPEWAVSALPQGLKWGTVLLACFGIWIATKIVKRIVHFIGRRMVDKAHPFEGSAWDMGGSVAQFLSLILLSPIALKLAGYDIAPLIAKRGPGAVAAVVTLIIAIFLAGTITRAIRGFGDKAHANAGADDTLFAFMASMIKYMVFAVALVFALTQLGFPTTSLAALLGAAGLAIALALQDTLKAVAAGVMLAMFRPFRLGDYVTVNGYDGEVSDISPFQTTIKQIDNRVVTITNDKVWGEALVNHTRQSRRRLDLYFDISYDDDMDTALELLHGIAVEHGRVMSNEDIWVGVHELSDWSIKLRLRAWVLTPEFVQVRADITKRVKEVFDANGVTIPYPHQVEIQYRGSAAPSGEKSSVADEIDTDDEGRV
jgi:small-conductance mechanosensitive channel